MGGGEYGTDGGVATRCRGTAQDVSNKSGDTEDRAEFGVPGPRLGARFAFVSVFLIREANRDGPGPVCCCLRDGFVFVVPEGDILKFDGLGTAPVCRRRCFTRAERKEETHDSNMG